MEAECRSLCLPAGRGRNSVHRDLGTFSLLCGRAALRHARDPHIWPVTQHFGCFNWLQQDKDCNWHLLSPRGHPRQQLPPAAAHTPPSPTSQDYGDISHVVGSIMVSAKEAKFFPSVTLQRVLGCQQGTWDLSRAFPFSISLPSQRLKNSVCE